MPGQHYIDVCMYYIHVNKLYRDRPKIFTTSRIYNILHNIQTYFLGLDIIALVWFQSRTGSRFQNADIP